MIATILMVLAQGNPVPEIIEYPNPNQSAVAIEAVVRLPKLNSSQRYVLSQAMNIAVQMTPEYGNRDVLRILQTGTRFQLYQAADHLRIGLTVENDDLGAGLSLLRSVLTEPTFLPDTIKVQKSNLTDPWAKAYGGFISHEVPLDRNVMMTLWQGIMKPQNISVGISGQFADKVPTEKWKAMQSSWTQRPQSDLPLPFPPKHTEMPNNPPLLIFESKPIKMDQAKLASYLLAANVLGVGKDSLQWLIAREEMGISYRQESFLVSTEEGWKFRMAYGTDQDGTKPETITALKQKLKERCAALTQSDLDHAVGLGRGYLVNQMPTLPIVLGIGDVLSNNVSDRLYLRHYWKTKFGFDWSANTTFVLMQQVELGNLKKLLSQILDESDVRIY